MQKFKVEEITTRVPKRTVSRKTWARFGDARDQHVRADEQSIQMEDPNSTTEEEPAADIKNLGLIRQKLEARKKGLLPSANPADSFADYEGPGKSNSASIASIWTMHSLTKNVLCLLECFQRVEMIMVDQEVLWEIALEEVQEMMINFLLFV